MRKEEKIKNTLNKYKDVIWMSLALVLFYLVNFLMQEKGSSFDCDTYAHLQRFKQFWETGSWAEQVFPWTNYPFGEAWHYTRLFDVIALVFVYPLHFLFGVERALQITAYILPGTFYVLSGLFICYGLRPYQKSIVAAVLAFVFGPSIIGACLPGQFDHHFLEVFFIAASLGCLMRYFKEEGKRDLTAAAVLTALSFWAGVEGFFVYTGIMGGLFVLYLIRQEKIKNLLWFQSIYTACLFCFLLVNPSYEGFFYIELGRLSFFYLLFNVFVLGTFWILSKTPQKAGYKMGIPVVMGTGFILLFKEAVAMPLMSRFLYENWYWTLWDTAAMVFAKPLALLYYGAVLILFYLYADRKQKKAHVFLFFLMVFFWCLASYQMRFGLFLSVVCAFALPLCFRKDTPRHLLPVAILLMFAAPQGILYGKKWIGHQEKSFFGPEMVLPYIETGAEEGPILAQPDYAMFFMYHTKRPTIAWNFYRDERGLTYYYLVMEANKKKAAEKLLKNRGIKTIVVNTVYAKTPQAAYTFYHQLVKGDPVPDFVEEMALPENVHKRWRVFKVK